VQGQFITSLCQDATGHTWIGTEDNGVWRFDPSAPKDKQYTHYTTKDGLGDNNAYALCCDKAGRIWAGTLNHGVSVFNGKAWKTYGPVDGPLGSRVFALAVNPKDGGVWGATDAGLFRYQNSRWTYFTRADDLPSDQANALAFDPEGTLYVGTQCDGIAIASPADNYKSWRVVPGPKTLPQTATGAGLPSALINCLLVTQSGTVYAGTTCGLAGSKDGGLTWSFVRGLDWKAKLAGLYHPITPAPAVLSSDLLSEDYVTCLAEGGDGRLFVGHRQTGLEAFSTKTGLRVQSGENASKTDSYIFSLLLSEKTAWVGLYGGGLLPPDTFPAGPKLASAFPSVAFPVPAKAPTLAELNAMLRVVSAVAPDRDELKPKVVALNDDWVTQGDWLGRYGRYWACLNAICSPEDYLWGAGWEPISYSAQIGTNETPEDSLRYWVQWLYSQDPRVLELPPTYLDSRVKRGLTTSQNNRREAEHDDHGETYPQTLDGPHLFTTLTIPAGLFYLSLYNVNYNGHGDNERRRDYHISIRDHSGTVSQDVSALGSEPEFAHGRVANLWGGAWKRFLVRGPTSLTVEINRNNSFNTISPAVMLDLLDETPPPYFGSVDQWEEVQRHNEEQRQEAQSQGRIALFQPIAIKQEAANCLLDALGKVQFMNSGWWCTNSRQFYTPLLRWYTQAAGYTPKEQKAAFDKHSATCCYQMGQYQKWEEVQKRTGLTPARDIEKSLRWDGISSCSGLGYLTITNLPHITTRSQAR